MGKNDNYLTAAVWVFILGLLCLLLGLIVIGTGKTLPQGFSQDCLIFDEINICLEYCSCRWRNDTKKCMGRVYGDVEMFTETCWDNVRREENKKNSWTLFMIIVPSICFVLSIIFIIIYNKCPDCDLKNIIKKCRIETHDSDKKDIISDSKDNIIRNNDDIIVYFHT
jgi:hypothetical protein